jgi:galactokinase
VSAPNGASQDRIEALVGALDEAYGGGTDGSGIVRAPGRVNLMGDHTDYNDGFVLPAAIELDTWIAYRPRQDGLVRLVSRQSPARCEFRIDAVSPDAVSPDAGSARTGRGWADYVAGTAWSLREAALPIHGLDGVVDSTVPLGVGLASSAALELAAALALLGGSDSPDGPSLASLAQRAERDYVGVNCGIMDQFAAAMGLAGRAILLDCRSLESRYVTLPEGVSVVVGDTGSPRELRTSAYNERRADCGRAVALLAERLPSLASLRDLDAATLRRNRHLLPRTIARRAEHVVGENARVLATVAALEAGDLDALGHVFAESHKSLRLLYEVSSPELDAMVEIAAGVRGVVGTRMTGAGFGGCTVSLVRDEAVPALTAAIMREYPRRTGLEPRVYAVATAAGAGRVRRPVV